MSLKFLHDKKHIGKNKFSETEMENKAKVNKKQTGKVQFSIFPNSTSKFWQTATNRFIIKRGSLAPSSKFHVKMSPKINIDENGDILPSDLDPFEQEKAIKKDIENIDNWVFQNISKSKITMTSESAELIIKKTIKDHQSCMLPDLDLRFLDLVLHESKKSTSRGAIIDQDMTDQASINKKIAVTSETINREYNKNIMIGLIKKKLLESMSNQNFNENYLYMISKIILIDFVSSFKVLEHFRHQNILQIKTLLSESKEDIQKSIKNSLNGNPRLEFSKQTFRAYENAISENYFIVLEKIQELKMEALNAEARCKGAKSAFLQQQDRLKELIFEKDQKESQSAFLMKFGHAINVQEFMVVNDLKKKIEDEERKILKVQNEHKQKLRELEMKNDSIKNLILDLKFKKSLFAIKLQEFYRNLLLNENDLLNYDKTVVEVTCCLFNFNCDFKKGIFSEFYSQNDIQFILSYSKMLKKMNELKTHDEKDQKLLKKQHDLLFKKITLEKENNDIENIKKTIKNLKSGNLCIFEKKFVKRHKSVIMKWEIQKPNSKMDEQKNFLNVQKTSILETCYSLNPNYKTVGELARQMAFQKEIYVKFVVGNLSSFEHPKINASNLQKLKKMFTLMFGPREFQRIMNEFKESNL